MPIVRTPANWFVALLTALALASLVHAGCSATTNGGDGGGGATSTSSGTAASGAVGFGGSSGEGGAGAACASETYPGELVPLDLYVMLDQSASMSDTGKWSSVIAALQTFVTAPESDGIGVGLQYFPVPRTGPPPPSQCNGDPNDPACGLYGPCMPIFNQCGGALSSDSCDPADYDQAEIDIAVLPGVSAAIQGSLSSHSPNGDSTPSQPAMEGAVSYATAWAQAHPSHLTFIVFATDGDPTNCTYNSVQGTADAAAQAAGGTPQVKTFVIGVGSELTSLNQIAQAGGTGQAYLVDTGQNVTQQFIDALNEIRAMGQCKLQIPVPADGDPDFDRVNVTLVDPNDPSQSETIYYVDHEAACDPVTGGWYYDDPADPKIIILCPATCDKVQSSDVDIKVVLGCKTIIK